MSDFECVDPTCECLCHVSVTSHVPCCPACDWPLAGVLGKEAVGYCVDSHCGLGWRRSIACDPGVAERTGYPICKWIDREVFNYFDMPPYNGWITVYFRDEDGEQ